MSTWVITAQFELLFLIAGRTTKSDPDRFVCALTYVVLSTATGVLFAREVLL